MKPGDSVAKPKKVDKKLTTFEQAERWAQAHVGLLSCHGSRITAEKQKFDAYVFTERQLAIALVAAYGAGVRGE